MDAKGISAQAAPNLAGRMSIRIRRAKIEDAPAIGKFIRAAYAELAPFKGPDRWRWQFVDNPFIRELGDMVPVWIALEGDDVVGQIAVQATEVHIANRVHSGGWIVDVMILPAYRGRKLGHLLYEAVALEIPLLLTLTMALATRRMAERIGAITLGPTRQFTRLIRPRADDIRRYLLQRTAHRERLAQTMRWACNALAIDRLVALLANIWLRHSGRSHRAAKSDIEVVQIDRFGPDIDELWRRTKGSYPAI